jgi:hypothetical protein
MQKAEFNQTTQNISTEKIIDLIRNLRNDLVKEYLQDDALDGYLERTYNKKISPIKKEFLKRDLKELLISPVDLVHYSRLITQIKDTGVASLSLGNSDLFYKDLDKILSKYLY